MVRHAQRAPALCPVSFSASSFLMFMLCFAGLPAERCWHNLFMP